MEDLRNRLSGFGVGQAIVLLAATLIVAGAMAARGLSARVASSAALAISVLLVVLTVWYYRLYVYAPVSAGWGLYLGRCDGGRRGAPVGVGNGRRVGGGPAGRHERFVEPSR